MTYYIHADKFFLENVTEQGGYLEVQDDGKFGFYYTEDQKPEGKIVDYKGKWIAPGLVDTHVHGSLKEDVRKVIGQELTTCQKAFCVQVLPAGCQRLTLPVLIH